MTGTGGPTRIYPRDLIGYGRDLPAVRWPGGRAVAVQIVLNYEEGGEYNILHGDEHSEAFVTEEPTRQFRGARNLNVESQYEYGSRVGFWRLHRILTERAIPVTVFGTAMALARNPAAVAAMKQAGWEIASHGYRWINYDLLTPAEEREHLRRAVAVHTEVTGERPVGWYQGRTSRGSRRFLVEDGGFAYDADSFADDLPFWMYDYGRPHLVVPYTLDNNDVRFAHPYGYGGLTFDEYLSGGLGLLIREGRLAMMSVGLHCRLAGRPGRAALLERFLDELARTEDVWLARRIDIAEYWRSAVPPDSLG
jgi:putative urate catabolism protein